MGSIFELGWCTVGSLSKKTISQCDEIIVMYVAPVVHISHDYIGHGLRNLEREVLALWKGLDVKSCDWFQSWEGSL